MILLLRLYFINVAESHRRDQLLIGCLVIVETVVGGRLLLIVDGGIWRRIHSRCVGKRVVWIVRTGDDRRTGGWPGWKLMMDGSVSGTVDCVDIWVTVSSGVVNGPDVTSGAPEIQQRHPDHNHLESLFNR